MEPIIMFFSERIGNIFTLSESSLSAAEVANNVDLLTEILVRLPVKSLLKFKCVSKHWLTLISNPVFQVRLKFSADSPCALFVRRLPYGPYSYSNNPVFDFIKLDSSFSEPPFESLKFFNDPSGGIDIIESCNGLLLCSSHQEKPSNYYIYNPTTEQHTVLPPLSGIIEYGPRRLHLAFDPSKSPHYKVICLRVYNRDPDYNIEIYSSETGLWRVSDASISLRDWDTVLMEGVLWKGAIYWVTNRGPSFYLDIDKERIQVMSMPPVPPYGQRGRRTKYFEECKGHLHLVEIYYHPATEFDVLELERDCSRWFVKYRVNLQAVISSFPEMINTEVPSARMNHYAYNILCIVREQNEDESYMVLHIPAKIIKYNFKDKSVEKLCNFTPGKGEPNYKQETAVNFNFCRRAYQYIRNLAVT